eukprot:12230725-Alexandrium_andersonii.AAC.1
MACWTLARTIGHSRSLTSHAGFFRMCIGGPLDLQTVTCRITGRWSTLVMVRSKTEGSLRYEILPAHASGMPI